MKKWHSVKGWLMLAAFAVAVFNLEPEPAFAQGTAFTYQGCLSTDGRPANGSYDLEFSLHDAVAGGNLIAGPLTNAATAVASGVFTVTLDFGPVFNGSNYWLEIGARTNGDGGFTTLNPRQAIAPAPYAIYAANAKNAVSVSGVLAGGSLSGAYSNTLTLTNAANQFVGSFAGNGAGLSNLSGGGNFVVVPAGSDTAAVQAALSLGTNVQFARGIYTLTNLTLANNTHLWGYGAILQFAPGSSGFFIDQGTNTYGTIIEGLTLDGLNPNNYSSGPPLITEATAIQGGLAIYWAATAGRHGIRINGGGGNIVRDCTLRGFNGMGFMLVCSNDINSSVLPSHAVITGNNIYSNYYGGYFAANSYDYPAFYHAPQSLWTPQISAEDHVLSGNYIFANGIGIAALSGNHNITGNLISCNYCSVYIGGGWNTAHGIIQGNTINHSFYAVRCDSGPGREFVNGNAILDDNYPLWVDGSDWVCFQNNLVSVAPPGGLVVTNSTATGGMIVLFRDNAYQGAWSNSFANSISYGDGSGTVCIFGNHSVTVTGDTDGSAESLIQIGSLAFTNRISGGGFASGATNCGPITASGWTNNTALNCVAYVSGSGINITNMDGSGKPYMTNSGVTGTITLFMQPGAMLQTKSASGFYHAE